MAYVDPSNADAARSWDGSAGEFWTDNADLFDAGVARYLQPFLAAAAIGPAAQVADVGVGRYDRAISRTGVTFFGDPIAAFANLARALKPDGRMVLLVWQSYAENEWLAAFFSAVATGRDIPPPPSDGPGPFSLGNADRVHAVLTAVGFGEPELVGVREPMFFGRDVATAEAMVLGIVGVTYRSAMWIVTAQ